VNFTIQRLSIVARKIEGHYSEDGVLLQGKRKFIIQRMECCCKENGTSLFRGWSVAERKLAVHCLEDGMLL